MLDKLFGSSVGWRRYYLPRTGYTLFGSFYFFFTFQFTLFVLHFLLEAACLMLFLAVFPSSGFYGFLLPRLVIPFIMDRYACMNHLDGAWRVDWVLPILFFFTFV